MGMFNPRTIPYGFNKDLSYGKKLNSENFLLSTKSDLNKIMIINKVGPARSIER